MDYEESSIGTKDSTGNVEDIQTTITNVENRTEFEEQLQNDNVSVRHNIDVVPSTSTNAARELVLSETTCDICDKEESPNSPKTTMKTEVNIKIDKQLNSTKKNKKKKTSGSAIKNSDLTKSDTNNKTNKTVEQVQITVQQAYNTNIIGTGPSYTGGGIKNTFHGVSYQMKLAMHYIVYGLQQNCQFQVATEVEEAGKLDDLLFLYEDNEIGFFQAKHKLNENLLINEEQLLSKDDDFSISKYFHSYLQILNERKLQNVLKDRDMTLMLKTNIGIESSVLNNFELMTASSRLTGNKIMALGTERERAGYYVINKGSSLYNKLVASLLKIEEPPTQVAQNLAKAVVNNKKKSIKVDELFDRYCEWLLDKVLEDGVEINKKQKRYFVTFKDSFFSASDTTDTGTSLVAAIKREERERESLLNFKQAFLGTYMSNTIGKKDAKSIQKDLSGIKFQIPKSFVSTIKTAKIRSDALKNFFEILVFAVNQPNETTLGTIIEKEISDYVEHTDRQSIASKFKLYIQDWAKQRESRYLTNNDIERQFAVWGQETLNQIRMDDINKYSCTFEESNEVIKNILKFLTENDANVFCLYDREALFSKIKVCQALEIFTSENIDQHFIFCDIKDLIELENTKKCPVKAFRSQTCNILFVSGHEGKLHSTEVLNRLLQIVIEFNRSAKESQFLKRLIISIPEKEKLAFINKFCFNNLGIKSESLDDFDYSFSELDERSRRQLVEKSRVNFHGNNVTGLLSVNELSPYIRNEMLLKLISNELEIGDGLAVTNHYYNEKVKQYYINRSLVPLIVSQNITEDPIFHFIREDTSQMTIKNQEVVIVSSNEKLFENFRKTNTDVHWLKEVNSGYIWVTSQGTLTNLRKYVTVQDLDRNENCIPITNVSDLKNDIVLITASPGMGKSILLSHVAEQARRDDTSFLVIKINLADYCTQLDSIDEENITIKQAINFAFIATRIEPHQTEESQSAFNLLTFEKDGSIKFTPDDHFDHLVHLRAMVFCEVYNKEKIVLLLDGFDEIAPDYCKTTSKLLHTLKHSKVHKMWVTTRPYSITKTLENDLETFAYTLKPLSKDNQLTLIKNFWGHQIKSGHTNIISSLNDFINSIIMSTLSALHKAEKKQTSNNTNFMGVPLHCYMLAKVLTKDFTKFCSQDKDVSVDSYAIEKPLTIFDLYSNFFNIKFDEILYNVNLKEPKNTIFRNRKKDTETDHGKLGLVEIFDDRLPIELVQDEDRIKLLTLVKSGSEKLGFVAEVVDNRPRFVHRTFAEYFAAHYLAKILLNSDENKGRTAAAKSLLYNSITCNKEYYYVLFTFFNYVVVSKGKNKDIFEAAITGNIRRLSNIENLNEMLDPLNRTPTHLIAINLSLVFENLQNAYRSADLTTAAEMYNKDHVFIQRLCESLIENSCDTLFMWTPSHYLTLCPVKYILRELPFAIQYLNDVTQDAFGRTPLMLLILNYSSVSSISIANSRSNFNSTCVNIQDNFLKTALHYALENFKDSISSQERNPEFKMSHWKYHLKIICFLLKNGARLDIPDRQCTTPVDIINSLVTKNNEHIFKRLRAAQSDVVHHSTSGDTYHTNLNYITGHVEKLVYNASGFDDFNTPDRMSGTAVQYTVKQKHSNAVSNLVYRCLQPDVALEKRECLGDGGDSERKCLINTTVKGCLTSILLEKIFDDYDQPLPPAASSEVFSLFFLDMLPPETAEFIIKTTDLLTLSTNIDDHKNIFIFVLNRRAHIAKILLSKFPHFVDVVDTRGRTALHYAVKNINRYLIISLIQSNARVDIPDHIGKMPAYINKPNDGKYTAYFERTWQVNQEFDISSGDQQTLSCIEQLPFNIAKHLVLTMALIPPLTPFDHALLNTIFDYPCYHPIAAILWAEYSDLLKATSSKTNYTYLDCTKVSNKVMYILLENYRVEDFSDNALKSNLMLKSAVELFSSVKNNNLSQVQSILKRVETYCVDTLPEIPTVRLPYKEVHMAAAVVNARTKNGGKTALHYVAEIGNAEIAHCLLSHGGWYNVPDFQDATPAQIAKTHANTAVSDLFNTVEMLFNCLYNEAYDIAQSIVVKEKIDGNLFYCICYQTKRPLTHLTLKQKNWLLFNSLVFH